MTRNDKIVRSAIAYVRVSSTKQADSGLGEATQLDSINRWATLHGLAVTVFKDLGVSGRRRKRPTLEEAITFARATRSPLVVFCLSRLARSTIQTLQIVEQLDKAGVELVSLRESIDTRSACGRAMLSMLATMAQLEAELASERTRDALRVARSRGLRTGGSVPYGYVVRYVGRDKRLVPDPRYADVIDEIKRSRATGASLRSIAQQLNARSVKTAHGCRWMATQVASVIKVADSRRAVA